MTWPVACLHLIAESARRGLRELDRLETAAEQGRGARAGTDRRSRLPDALDALDAHRCRPRRRSPPGSGSAADRDGVAADVAGGGGGEGDDRTGKFPRVRGVRSAGPALPSKRSASTPSRKILPTSGNTRHAGASQQRPACDTGRYHTPD